MAPSPVRSNKTWRGSVLYSKDNLIPEKFPKRKEWTDHVRWLFATQISANSQLAKTYRKLLITNFLIQMSQKIIETLYHLRPRYFVAIKNVWQIDWRGSLVTSATRTNLEMNNFFNVFILYIRNLNDCFESIPYMRESINIYISSELEIKCLVMLKTVWGNLVHIKKLAGLVVLSVEAAEELWEIFNAPRLFGPPILDNALFW